jgi:hypothetical protein
MDNASKHEGWDQDFKMDVCGVFDDQQDRA